MSEFGAFFRADDGTLAVTSDTPCYELYKEVLPASRSGNVNTYSVDCSAVPLVAVNCGVNGSGGILAIEGSAGAWTVSVLASVSCSILVFVPISGAASGGYGIRTFDAGGTLVFDSSRKVLNARNVTPISEGTSFQGVSGITAVSYTSGPVKPSVSVSEEWIEADTYSYVTQEYVCDIPSYQRVCTPSFSLECGLDWSGNFVCNTVWGETCYYELVQNCNWVTVLVMVFVDALVETTTWSIERAVAKINSNSAVSFAWLPHKSGYYKKVKEYRSGSAAIGLSAGLPGGYILPPLFLTNTEVVEGELNKDNTYPYTTDRANNIPLICITVNGSDYA